MSAIQALCQYLKNYVQLNPSLILVSEDSKKVLDQLLASQSSDLADIRARLNAASASTADFTRREYREYQPDYSVYEPSTTDLGEISREREERRRAREAQFSAQALQAAVPATNVRRSRWSDLTDTSSFHVPQKSWRQRIELPPSPERYFS